MAIPLGLRNALEAGRATLFLGAGIGHNVLGPNGTSSPTGADLAKELVSKFDLQDVDSSIGLPKVAQLVEIRRGREELDAFLKSRLDELAPDDDLLWLLSRTWASIYTTNYDDVIATAYAMQSEPLQKPVIIASSNDLVPTDPRFEVPVIHLHGSLFQGTRPFALITSNDYAKFREHRRMLFEILKISFATSPILYVGYANEDPNWALVTEELRAEFEPNRPPLGFRVDPYANDVDIEIHREAHNISTIKLDLSAFVAQLRAEVGDLRIEPHKLDSIANSVQSGMRSAVQDAPAATVRANANWTHISSIEIKDAPNTDAFLKGDLPNWSTVSARIPFQRDVEDDVFDELLDFCTSPSPIQRSLAVLGPAGYGTSTLLMTLALRLAEENAATVFLHKRGAPLLQADVEFLVSAFSGPKVFVVDNAADHGPVLASIAGSLRSHGSWGLLLLGDRLNEWRQSAVKMRPREVLIERLSDGEIDRLLQMLQDTSKLGYLSDLTDDDRRRMIDQRLGKELLVVLREITENNTFAAIIENEYQGIQSRLGREIYAAVSVLARFRVAVRAGVIAALLDEQTAAVLTELGKSLEGVVLDEGGDDAFSETTLRTRHAVIAQMVWDRCVSASTRQRLVRTALDELNLHYAPDRVAFEKLTRSDDVVDSFQLVSDKSDFFEAAVKKDPRNPYVRQHYARMLLREREYEAGLAQIDLGLEMRDSPRILLHTRGQILAAMAIDAASIEVGRKRLNQAEAVYRQVIKAAERDEYGYHGLGNLYLDWAQRVGGTAESVAYLTKAEEAVETGLQMARRREFLGILSADIRRYMGDVPEALATLRKVVAEESQATSTARYLLGRALVEGDNLAEAVTVLQPFVGAAEEHPRACLLMARAKLGIGASYSEAIAVLRTSEASGGRDPRFVAYLGGLLYLDGSFTDSRRWFERAKSEEFSGDESNRMYFVPDEDAPQYRRGTVLKVFPGYSWIGQSAGPDVFVPGSKYRQLVLAPQQRVEFRLGFTARGATGYDVRLAEH